MEQSGAFAAFGGGSGVGGISDASYQLLPISAPATLLAKM